MTYYSLRATELNMCKSSNFCVCVCVLELDAPSGQLEAVAQTDGQSLRSVNVESVRERNHQRMRRLEDMSKPSGRPGQKRWDWAPN